MSSANGIHPLDGFSIFGLVVFIAVMIPVLRPFRIPLGTRLTRSIRQAAVASRLLGPPRPDELSPSWYLPFGLTVSPALGVLVLLCTTTIDSGVIRSGIVGDGDSKPYDVLVLFISLAYIATALDSTGLLRSLAFYVSNKSNGSGPQLYLILYCFFFISGVIFGNDPIILSGTAFLTYFLKNCGITHPIAWIMMEFIASNIASAVLVSSNPTNVLIAQAFDLNFLTGFTKYTILPSLGSAVLGYILLYSIFRSLSRSISDTHLSVSTTTSRATWRTKILRNPLDLFPRANYIPDRLNQPRVSPRSVLNDTQGALFHGSLMVLTLIVLVGTSFVKSVQVWEIALPAGVLALGRDLVLDGYRWFHRSSPSFDEVEMSRMAMNKGLGDGQTNQDPSKLEVISGPREVPTDHQAPTKEEDTNQLSNTVSSTQPPLPSEINTSDSLNEGTREAQIVNHPSDNQATLQSYLKTLNKGLPLTSNTLSKLPLSLLPFAISIFILVRSLVYLGWVNIWARWIASICTGPVKTVYFFGFLGSLVLCPFAGTNIGATILMIEIIKNEEFYNNPQILKDPLIIKSAIFSISMSCNLGAFSLTLSSSLAGLLWYQILLQKNIGIKKWDFLKWNIVPQIVLGFVAYTIVVVEILYLF